LAAEHSAQLTGTPGDSAFNKVEEYKFQDIALDGKPPRTRRRWLRRRNVANEIIGQLVIERGVDCAGRIDQRSV
jgi:hypothetical protein